MRRRASRIKLALNAPHSPRLAVMTTSATRRLFPPGWRSRGNRSASSGAYRSPITSASAAAYGRAATTRSCARFSFDVATSSIVFVILRVFWTDRMRRRSSRGFAMSAGPQGLVFLDRALQLSRTVFGERLAGADLLTDLGVLRRHEVVEAAFPIPDRVHRDVVQEPVGHGEDDHHLLLYGHRAVLRLLQHLDRARTAIELPLRGGVELGGELGERLQLAVLREVQAEPPGYLFHRLDLRVAAHPRDRDADVHGGTHIRVEQVGLEEDLTVGDGDDVRGNVGRHVARLRLDDRQRGERARAHFVG